MPGADWKWVFWASLQRTPPGQVQQNPRNDRKSSIQCDELCYSQIVDVQLCSCVQVLKGKNDVMVRTVAVKRYRTQSRFMKSEVEMFCREVRIQKNSDMTFGG